MLCIGGQPFCCVGIFCIVVGNEFDGVVVKALSYVEGFFGVRNCNWVPHMLTHIRRDMYSYIF